MNRTRAPAFHSAEKLIAPGRRVAVVGHISRTWHKDEGVIAELLEYLLALGADAGAIGRSPFRLCMQRAFELGGLHCDLWAEGDPEAHAFLAGSDLVVALGPRTTKELDQPLCTTALELGIPVLALWPDDRATFFPAADAATASNQ